MTDETRALLSPVIDAVGFRRTFCGPTAISVLTKQPTSKIEQIIRRGRSNYYDSMGRKRPVKGIYTHEAINALHKLGCKTEKMLKPEKTLGRFLEDTKHIPAFFLVNVTGHFTVTYKGECSDWAGKKPKMKVKNAWKVMPPPC